MGKRMASGGAGLSLSFFLACSSPSGPDSPAEGSPAVALEGGSTLVFADGGRLDAERDALTRVVRDTVVAVRRLMDVNGVTIRVEAGTRFVIPEIGLGGRTNGTGEVVMVVDPESPKWPASLSTGLFPLLAHELHHVMRFRTAGFNSHLLDSMVTEGLADQFAIEVAGIAPPMWSIALSPEELEVWSERARAEWYNSSYDHDAWFFGEGVIPRWAGYSIGFELTRAYLETNRGRPPSRLIGVPSSEFVPD
jgi:uncharacterized protein YjaZ